MIQIKNTSTIEEIIFSNLNKRLAPEEIYNIPETSRIEWAHNDEVLSAIANNEVVILLNDVEIEGIDEQISKLRKEEVTSIVKETPPFAKPDFRTKMSATTDITNCSINQSTNIDYQITEERYVSGGSCCIKNAKFGDYVTAEVYDKDGVIPEAYRASLCENWPCVAKYIEKRWVLVNDESKNINIFFDTYPLNAKISAGLYLRIAYHAINEGSTRQIIINYNLTKKL